MKSIYTILIGYKPGRIGISFYNNLVYRVESRNQNLKAYKRKIYGRIKDDFIR